MVVWQTKGRRFRIGTPADPVPCFQDGDRDSALHQCPGCGEASHPRPDNDHFRVGRDLCQRRYRQKRRADLQ